MIESLLIKVLDSRITNLFRRRYTKYGKRYNIHLNGEKLAGGYNSRKKSNIWLSTHQHDLDKAAVCALNIYFSYRVRYEVPCSIVISIHGGDIEIDGCSIPPGLGVHRFIPLADPSCIEEVIKTFKSIFLIPVTNDDSPPVSRRHL